MNSLRYSVFAVFCKENTIRLLISCYIYTKKKEKKRKATFFHSMQSQTDYRAYTAITRVEEWHLVIVQKSRKQILQHLRQLEKENVVFK